MFRVSSRWKDRRARPFRGSKSRNKVSVGEPADGSFPRNSRRARRRRKRRVERSGRTSGGKHRRVLRNEYRSLSSPPRVVAVSCQLAGVNPVGLRLSRGLSGCPLVSTGGSKSRRASVIQRLIGPSACGCGFVSTDGR